jgi:hypothetical protein
LDPQDVKAFKEMTAELRDTWTKKQVFRTETEMRMSVLQDMKYPTKAAKYWQCVREQNVFLENLMNLSFECRRQEAKIKWLEKKIETEKDDYKLTKLWSTLKKEFDDGSFDTKDVNRHQLDSYHLIMKNKAETLTSGSSQPEVFNVLGQLKSIERVKKSGEMIYNKKEQLTDDLGAKPKV